MEIIYYSGVSENTHRFVAKTTLPSKRIPISQTQELHATEPYLLVVPTYVTTKRAVPPQVVKFLNIDTNRALLRGVIGTGNTNFNQDYCIAAKIVAEKCSVPYLYSLEIMGTVEDVEHVQKLYHTFKNQETEQGETSHE